MMNANYHLQAGQVFARYEIVRTIGEGGMGTVYEAFHPVLKKRFAIKTLLASVAQVPDARARFLREAEIAARINHPNIVRVTDVGTDGEIPYLVMEYLEGQTLGGLLAARGRLEIIEAMDIMLPVISALAAGHAQGIVHRDLKPENIFLTQGPWGEVSPKVLDFGVSKLMGDAGAAVLTGTMTVLGTAAYMSPEQARGAREVDHRSDQYALGLILYELLTGARGHPGDNPFEVLHHIATCAIVPPVEYRPDCPPTLEAIVMRMLAPVPEDRFPSLLDVGAALLAFASEKCRHTMADAFPQHVTTVVLPAIGAEAQDSTRRQSTPSGSELGATKMLPTGERPPASERRPGDASTTVPVARGWHGRAPFVGVAAAGIALLAVVLWALLHKPTSVPGKDTAASSVRLDEKAELPPPPSKTIDVEAIPAEASLSLDGSAPVNRRLQATVPADGKSHVLRVWAPGYQAKTFVLGPSDTPAAQVRLDPAPETTSGERPQRAARNRTTDKVHKTKKLVETPSDPTRNDSERGEDTSSRVERW
jgi:serine/threonine protein kinase